MRRIPQQGMLVDIYVTQMASFWESSRLEILDIRLVQQARQDLLEEQCCKLATTTECVLMLSKYRSWLEFKQLNIKSEKIIRKP